ncbi:hypothetical protein [Herbiconiux liangxiaofengii]|uniref:hypothetical protein n=1 Tax=Herbiconiux liangxiaofengii TaxID=3342795 RepID=UPI0035B93D6A
MTTVAKRVGGPVMLGLMTAIGGYVGLRSAEAGGRMIFKRTRTAAKMSSTACPQKGLSFEVAEQGEAGGGLTLRPGDQYTVLEGDGDSILIEVSGNPSNPYFVSGALLESISDFVSDQAV